MVTTIRARYTKGVIEPLEELQMEEGKEVTITISEIAEEPKGADPLDVTFGGWAGLIDAEELKKNIYSDRLIRARAGVKL
ncbi:MAG: antitoxin family protein [Chloroflexi bacterium]|nr:antitoxin family protein [Chloroflexota bacterium]